MIVREWVNAVSRTSDEPIHATELAHPTHAHMGSRTHRSRIDAFAVGDGPAIGVVRERVDAGIVAGEQPGLARQLAQARAIANMPLEAHRSLIRIFAITARTTKLVVRERVNALAVTANLPGRTRQHAQATIATLTALTGNAALTAMLVAVLQVHALAIAIGQTVLTGKRALTGTTTNVTRGASRGACPAVQGIGLQINAAIPARSQSHRARGLAHPLTIANATFWAATIALTAMASITLEVHTAITANRQPRLAKRSALPRAIADLTRRACLTAVTAMRNIGQQIDTGAAACRLPHLAPHTAGAHARLPAIAGSHRHRSPHHQRTGRLEHGSAAS